MQLPIVSGVVASNTAEFAVSTPLNLEPLLIESKISNGQLRTAVGVSPFTTGPGADRGGIVWNSTHYRVMGTKLVSVSQAGVVTTLGDVGGSGPVTLDYSFTNLIIRSSGKLYYWNGVALNQVTDEDLGTCIDVTWVDGYTMSTDGEYVVVTELSDPYQVKPLKYGSADSDPDPITGLIRARGEVYVLGTNTIQVFQNVGGNGFPFQNVVGATILVGCVSASAKCLFGQTFAFVGSARDDALGVYVAGQGDANKISTRVVDDALAAVADPTAIVLERRVSRDEYRLYVHLPAETWVFMAKATERAGQAVWYRCQSGTGKAYRPRYAVEAFGMTVVGDNESPALGTQSADISSHFDETTQWQFDVGFIYNNAKGAILDSVELVGLTGRGSEVEGSSVFMSMTRDGQLFSQERVVSLGKLGERTKRVQWRPHARVRNYMGLRFRGYSRNLAGFASCEVQARPLAV